MKYRRWTQRDAIKNYFPLPNEVFQLGLSSGEILVYTYLMYREDRETHQCYPSYKTIGKAVGMSPNTVRKYVTGLVEKHLITIESTSVLTRDGHKRNGNLLYTIRPMQEAIDYYYERQMQKLEEDVARQKAQAHLLPPCSPQAPPCAAFIDETSPSPAAPETGKFEAISEKTRRTKEKAGESPGAFRAPGQSLPPTVRAVSGNEG